MAATLAQSTSGRSERAGTSRILELDGLRALAILFVLGCHYPGFANLAWHIPEFGWIGVDIFFALSGYLITTILLGLRNRVTPYRTFYSRRFIRILPPYLVVTLFLFAVAIIQHWKLLNLAVSQLFFLQAFQDSTRDFLYALIHHPKFHLTHLPPLLQFAHNLRAGQVGVEMTCASAPGTYWSLSIEEYFYLLWAPIVLRCSRRNILRIALAICVVEMLLRWMAGYTAYFSLLSRFDALLFGALLALLFERWRHRGTPPWSGRFFAAIVACTSIAIAAILFAIRPILGREIRVSPLFLVVGLSLFSIGVAALIGLLLRNAGGNWWLGRLLRSRALVFIGTISYTMYLVHILAGAGIDSLFAVAGLRDAPVTEAMLSTLLTILISYASWHWLEKPLLRWKDRRFPNAPHPTEPVLS
jgi:peptidoglycan/LPS O-acetylase OafA/YrhL